MTAAPRFDAWLARFFETYYRQNPVNATFIGWHEHDHRLPDASADAIEIAERDAGSRLRELDALDREPLSPAQFFDRDIARGFLEIQQWEYASRHFIENPAWYTGEAIFGVFSLLLREFAPEQERIESVQARLRAIPRLLTEGRTNVRDAPTSWIERAVDECDGALSFFSFGLRHVRYSERLGEAAEAAVRAFEAYRSHLTESVHENPARASCGKDAFELLLRSGHFSEWKRAEIAARAYHMLERGREALAAGASDWRRELEKLADIHPKRDQYYESYQECWERCRVVAKERAILTWPDYPVDFVPRPLWARAAAPHLYFLFYRAPSPFDRLARVDYLVTPLDPDASSAEADRILRSTNNSVIKLNHVVHHGGIGHHVQNWHAHRAKSRFGQVAAVDCASRIAMLCGGTMAEGWACYATDLMDEAGFLTPLESFSQHYAHLRMAARAIVDVELHCGDMSFDEAVDFYVNEANMSVPAARSETTKNSMFPAAAVTYMVGSTLIHDLRTKLESKLGIRFSLRAFHDEFLSHGSIPVSIIRERMLTQL